MIASVCSYCNCIIKTRNDDKLQVTYSHGICRKCLPAVMAEVDRMADEMNAAEGRTA